MAGTDARVIDLLDGDLYAGDPSPTYAWLREHAPVYWDEGNELWGISRYDDILEIEKAKHVFISSDTAKGGYRPNLPSDPSIIGLDDPLHTKRRVAGQPRVHAADGAAVGGPREGDGRRPARRGRRARSGSRSSGSWRRRCPPR